MTQLSGSQLLASLLPASLLLACLPRHPFASMAFLGAQAAQGVAAQAAPGTAGLTAAELQEIETTKKRARERERERETTHHIKQEGHVLNTVGRRSSVVGGRWSVVGRRSSVVGGRSSVVGRRWSVVGGRSSVVGRRSSAVGRQSVVNRSSVVGRQKKPKKKYRPETPDLYNPRVGLIILGLPQKAPPPFRRQKIAISY